MAAFPLPPGSVIGILGGGQLGRMLAQAAARLGFDVAILDPEPDGPAARVAAHSIVGAYDDPDALKALADLADVITYEFENVPAGAVERLLSMGVEVAPGLQALQVAQDRGNEKSFLNGHGVPTVGYTVAIGPGEAVESARRVGVPCLMKTMREGYDGKGQRWIEHPDEAFQAFQDLGGVPVILEEAADFVRELSVIAARGRGGEIAVYPLGENHHEKGILRRTLAPAQVSPQLAGQAERIAIRILEGLTYVGVIGIELFEMRDGGLLANEFAPRVHNTGHWTQDGCEVDQFEQHIRAVAGWPLGPTAPIARVEMLNLLGDEAEGWKRFAAEPETRIHLYGKHKAKPGRKMGHVNKVKPLR
ncbi:5-(carboxyamino)imidazole ribonucleotide synthase [Phenylobacterium sp. VNQ135]|uniref:5-(carboxyamino)imidazole ribonucleotide synthase n=1 Tax=Phenylobacterium sp. VNQ135 TaxID=3400922 RepID=UPI003C113BCF